MITQAHFFDIDTLISVESNIWVISKDNPSTPIIKISQSEFNLIKKGVYKKHNSQLEMGGNNFWLPKNLMDKIKIRCKKHKCDITNLAFSMQEFINKEVIKELDYKIYKEHFSHLKNKTDDIYIICSKKSKNSYEHLINKLSEEFEDFGLTIKNFYFISETFYNRNDDNISHKKVRLLLQHLIGLKTDGDKFTNEELKSYNTIYYYDDNLKSLEMTNNSNDIFQHLLENSEQFIKSEIKNIIKNNDKVIVVRKVTHNKINIFSDKEVSIEYSFIKKTFESFIIKS